MIDGLRLPKSQIATKLYGGIALVLAVVYVLAAAATHFASHTEAAVQRFLGGDFGAALVAGNLELALEQQRGLVAQSLMGRGTASKVGAERTFDELAVRIAALVERLGHRPPDRLGARSADLTQLAAMVLAFVRDERIYEAASMAADYDRSARALQADIAAERETRSRAGEAALESLAVNSRTLITWVCAAAALSGLLLGPVGLLLLRRVLARLQGVATALIRLARNDTSVDIPGLGHEDEVGSLARSVAVFKARSIELLQKKGELERVNLQLDAAVNNMPLGLSMFDAQDRLLVCNKRYADMYGLPGALMRPGTARCAIWNYRERMGARHYSRDGDAEAGPEQSHSMIIEFADGRFISVSRQPLQGGGWVSLHEDITERRRQELAIAHLARHDVLTNLANRALFREHLQQALLRLRRGQGFAVFCLDLDRFKAVNDTLGHPVGDILLKQVSERLLGCVRQGDLVARLGGDEFAIIQDHVRSADSSEVLAARIVEAIAQPYEIGGHRIEISASIGMTLAPRDGCDADQLLKNADLALYRTKAEGRNGFSFFTPEMDAHVEGRRQFEADLRSALQRDELALSFHPTVCAESGKVAGLECQPRWTHPRRGTLGEAEIVTLAEAAGLAVDLGTWMLQQACTQAVLWPGAVKVAINLSPLQMKRDLLDTVLQALVTSGLSADRLELEVTEQVLMQDSENALATLHQLRQLGVRIVLDHFGRGYCSLRCLRSFPFDKIKIDGAFVADMERSEETRALVEAVVGLGNGLEMTTVGGGVESFAQLETLRRFGCVEAQGCYFGPAVAAGEVEALLAGSPEGNRNAA